MPPAAATVPSLRTAGLESIGSVGSGNDVPSISSTISLPISPRNTLSPAAITTYPAGQLMLPELATCLPIR